MPSSLHHTVSAHNEWSPLRSVIVGRAEHSCFPSEPKPMIAATMPLEHQANFIPNNPFPPVILKKAAAELDNFAQILQREGIDVLRPSKFAYANTLQKLEEGGSARVVRAPFFSRDTIYNGIGSATKDHGHIWAINNTRPAFDTADFMRFGKVIIGQLSNVTNAKGVEYVRAAVPSQYSVEILDTDDPHAMRIDATILPLRNKLLVYNEERVSEKSLRKLSVFQDWELHPYPFSIKQRADPPLYMTSPRLVLNALSLDEKRIMVEAKDTRFAAWVKEKFGMEPIMCPFQNVNSLGGSFHCATVDLVRG